MEYASYVAHQEDKMSAACEKTMAYLSVLPTEKGPWDSHIIKYVQLLELCDEHDKVNV